MESNRSVGSVLLVLLGRVVAAVALSAGDGKTELHLDCTNDYDTMMCCQLEAHSCTEYSVTLLSNSGYGEKRCVLKQNDPGPCRYCCSMEKGLIPGESHTARVWKGGNVTESKTIDVFQSIKPKPPTIVSVTESNGNFEVLWETNMREDVREGLCAEVTYYKKGDTEKKVIPCFKPATVGQRRLSRCEIEGQDLEPSSTYVVRVRTQISVSGELGVSERFGDSSKEKEFKTSASPISKLLAIIISLSLAAVILSGGIYACYVKYKKKWWDAVSKHPNPKLLTMAPSDQEVLKPVPPVISSVCVEPLIPVDSKPWSKMSLTDSSSGSLQQSSGISTGSSCLSYANTEPVDIKASVQDALCKVLPNISPISQLTTSPILQPSNDLVDVRAPDRNSGSSCFDNKTYSILIPPCPHQITADSSEVGMQVEIPCDSAYHSYSERFMGNRPDRQVPVCPVPAQQHAVLPPVVSSLVPTDMSYQQHNADSGSFSCAEDSSSSSVNTAPSCDVASRVEVGAESSADAVRGATQLNGTSEAAGVCDENPHASFAPAGSHSVPAVDDAYLAFQNVVGPPDVLVSEQRSGEHLDKYQEESFTTFPQSFLSSVVPGLNNDARSGQCLAGLQTPFLPLMSAHQSVPIITDSGYQSV